MNPKVMLAIVSLVCCVVYLQSKCVMLKDQLEFSIAKSVSGTNLVIRQEAELNAYRERCE